MTSPKYSHHFSVNNLPYGVASSASHPRQCATRLANTVIFLGVLQQSGFFDKVDSLPKNIFSNETLNEYAALPKSAHAAVRAHLQSALREPGLDAIPANAKADITTVQVHVPISIPGFTGK
jgi:fumarylacetoacetase